MIPTKEQILKALEEDEFFTDEAMSRLFDAMEIAYTLGQETLPHHLDLGPSYVPWKCTYCGARNATAHEHNHEDKCPLRFSKRAIDLYNKIWDENHVNKRTV